MLITVQSVYVSYRLKHRKQIYQLWFDTQRIFTGFSGSSIHLHLITEARHFLISGMSVFLMVTEVWHFGTLHPVQMKSQQSKRKKVSVVFHTRLADRSSVSVNIFRPLSRRISQRSVGVKFVCIFMLDRRKREDHSSGRWDPHFIKLRYFSHISKTRR